MRHCPGRNVKSKENVYIKIFPLEAGNEELLAAEIKLLSENDGKYLPRYYRSYFVDKKQLWIAMEYAGVDAHSLVSCTLLINTQLTLQDRQKKTADFFQKKFVQF